VLKNVIWASIFILAAAILQSTLLLRLAVYHAVPDFALGILVFSAYSNGVMTGQVTGFFSGLIVDFLSAAPLGLNAFMRTIIGSIAGLMKGIFMLDAVFLPMMLCALATLTKAMLLLLLSFLFAEGIRTYQLSAPVLWVELVFNTMTAPVLFGLLNRFSALLVGKKEI
jgi:rod shape-determining protein MreD